MTERTYSDRGFAQHQPIPGGTAYGGTVRVYESSSALAPRIWLAVEALTQSATIHLSLDAARALATDLIDLVEHHYQAKDGTLPLHRSGTLPTVCGTCDGQGCCDDTARPERPVVVCERCWLARPCECDE